MAIKQESRPAYHRRNDLKRLKELALLLPVTVTDEAGHYVVWNLAGNRLMHGRYEVVCAYLHGGIDALKLVLRRDTTSDAAMRAMTEGNFK